MIQKFEFNETELKGAYVIKPFMATDERGGLLKDYNVETFKANGIENIEQGYLALEMIKDEPTILEADIGETE